MTRDGKGGGLRYLSVCSGIEAATQAWHPLGWTPVAFAEIEPFPSAMLAHHYPAVPNWGDMTKFKDWPDEPIDLLVGGTPCQSFSVAGLRAGLADPRGNLMLTYGGIAGRYRPKWLVWENVPGVLSSNGGRDFGTFLWMLGELGYGVAYRVLDAQYVRTRRFPRAVPQRRRRVFVVGYLGDWRRAAAVLFDRESLSGHPPPRREAGQGVAISPALRAQGNSSHRLDSEAYVPVSNSGDVGYCLTASAQQSLDAETETLVAVAHALRGEGFDASEDGTGRGAPLVPVAFHPTQDPISSEGVCHSIGANSNATAAVAIQERAVSENPDAGPDGVGVRQDGAAYTLEARQVPQAVAFDLNQVTSKANRSIPRSDVLHTMPASSTPPHLASPWAVRRLTPRECERLQAFPEIRECVSIFVCLGDKSLNDADAETRCTTGQSNVLSAGESVCQQPAPSAGPGSFTSPQGQEQPVVLHVLIDYEREAVQLRSQGRCVWSASIAEKQNSSPLSMPVADFVRLVASLTEAAAVREQTGRAASQANMPPSTHPQNGKWSVSVSGREIEDAVAYVVKSTSGQTRHTTSTTLQCGQGFPTSGPSLTTLSCSVVRAIASFIPEQTLTESSFAVIVETVCGFTRIPYRGKAADQCPDGPRYKALGNSMAVNVMDWIGERIAHVDRIIAERTAA